MLRRSWMLVGLLGFAVGVAHAGWIYGLGAEGGYAYVGKNLKSTVAQNAGVANNNMRIKLHGRFGYEGVSRVFGLFFLGDVGNRSGGRAFGNLGVGLRLGAAELRVYDAWDFALRGGGEALHAGTGALSLALGRWTLGFYGYVPLGRTYRARYTRTLPALNEVAGSDRLQKGTEQTNLYDVALRGWEGRVWYTLPMRNGGVLRFGGGGYYLVRETEVFGKADPQIGPSVDVGMDFARGTSLLRVGIYGHYAYDKVLGQQIGFRLSFRLSRDTAEREFLGLQYGVVTASFVHRGFVGQGNNSNGGNNTGGGNGGGGSNGGGGNNNGGGGHDCKNPPCPPPPPPPPHHDCKNPPCPPPPPPPPHKGPIIVRTEKEFQDALNKGYKSIFVAEPVTLSGFQKLPDGVTLCGGSSGKCGEKVLYRFGVRYKGQNPGALRAPKDVLRLGANNTLENIDIISTARDAWYKALYVNSTVQDLGTITLKNVGVHGLVYFYQNVGRAKATYDVENLKILRRDADGKTLPFPSKSIPDPNKLDAVRVYHRYNGSNSRLERISMPSGEGALLTIASTGDDSSLEVRKFSASLGNPDKGLVFERPLFYIYAPGKGGKKEVGPVDLKGIRMQEHNVTGSGKNYHYDPLVMIRGGGGKRVHVASLTMPAKGNTYFLILPPFINPDALYPSRATLEVIEGKVDALDWPYNHRLAPSDIFLAIAGSTPWVLLYAYDSEFGPISIRFGVVTNLSLPTSPSVLELGLLSFVSSRLKGNVQFLSDGYGRIGCLGCRGAVFVGLTGTEAHPTYVDKKVTVSATYSQLLILNDHTYFLKGFGTVQGLRGNSENGYTGKIINATMGGPLKDHYTCVEKEGFLELPVCP